jgi:hypothetical protein
MSKIDFSLTNPLDDQISVKITSREVPPDEIVAIMNVMQTIILGSFSKPSNANSNEEEEEEEEEEKEEDLKDEYTVNALELTDREKNLVNRINKEPKTRVYDSTIPPGATPLSHVIGNETSSSHKAYGKGWHEGGEYGGYNNYGYGYGTAYRGGNSYSSYSSERFDSIEVKKEDIELPIFQNQTNGDTLVRMKVIYCDNKVSACKILKEVLNVRVLQCKDILDGVIPCPEITLDKAAELYGKLHHAQCFVALKEVEV